MNRCQFFNQMVLQQIGAPLLPSEYQQVESITNTLNGYIDTGIDQYGYEFELDIAFQSSSTRVLIGFIDAYAAYYFGKNASNYYELGGDVNSSVLATSRHICKFKVVETSATAVTCTLNIDGSIITRSSTKQPIATFCTGTRTSYPGVKTIYAIKARDLNNSLALNLLPCYRKSDNKPGMYDLVSNTFFTNAGTGEFTVGPEV